LTNRSARVAGVNYTTNVVCNPLYTVYFTTPKKDRLSIVKGLQNGDELEVILNPLTYELLENFQLATKWKDALKLLPQETVFSCTQFETLQEYVFAQTRSTAA